MFLKITIGRVDVGSGMVVTLGGLYVVEASKC